MPTIDEILNSDTATPTGKAMAAAMHATITILEIIILFGAPGVPSGELYARVMPAGITLDVYENIIALLKRTNLVTEENHVLRASRVAMRL